MVAAMVTEVAKIKKLRIEYETQTELLMEKTVAEARESTQPPQ
jgi:hypothetical protein